MSPDIGSNGTTAMPPGFRRGLRQRLPPVPYRFLLGDEPFADFAEATIEVVLHNDVPQMGQCLGKHNQTLAPERRAVVDEWFRQAAAARQAARQAAAEAAARAAAATAPE